jgi:hypothetical protein
MTDSRRKGEEAPEPESALAVAERHVRECEARVADQLQFIRELYADGYPEAEARARKVLVLLEDTCDTARRHFESESHRASAHRSVE